MTTAKTYSNILNTIIIFAVLVLIIPVIVLKLKTYHQPPGQPGGFFILSPIMKKAANTKPTIFSIYAEDKKGLLGQTLIHFNKKSYEVISLNIARTDISGLVMLTI